MFQLCSLCTSSPESSSDEGLAGSYADVHCVEHCLWVRFLHFPPNMVLKKSKNFTGHFRTVRNVGIIYTEILKSECKSHSFNNNNVSEWSKGRTADSDSADSGSSPFSEANIFRWCKGSTPVFGTGGGGSTPSRKANKYHLIV